jgi:hypothetical protein
MANANITVEGDSGASWYRELTAFGGHEGMCLGLYGVRSVFSLADYSDEALGITLRIDRL